MAAIFVGQEFTNYKQLSSAIEQFQKQQSVQYYKRDARTIASAAKRLARPLNAHLVYYDLRYCCIHGGKQFSKRGTTSKETS